MKFLSLFAGIGGFDLGLERAGMKCVGQVEIDPYCLAVLKHHWTDVKRMGDIHDVKGSEFGTIDLICGGVPCQPASCAGKRRGKEDNRWLWPEAFRLVREIKPAWCLFENVRGLTSLESGVVFDSLLSDLEAIGYEVQPFIIPACAVDAPHRRDRVWIIAYSEHNAGRSERRIKSRSQMGWNQGPEQDTTFKGCGDVVAYPKGERSGETGELQRSGPAERITGSGEDVSDTERQRCETGDERIRRKTGTNTCRSGEKPIMAYAECVNDDGAGYGASQICRQRPEAPEIFRSVDVTHPNQPGLEGKESAGVNAW